MHELVLLELIAVPAERSRGRLNRRWVERKMRRLRTKAPSARIPSK